MTVCSDITTWSHCGRCSVIDCNLEDSRGGRHVQVLLGADAVVAQGNEAGGHGALGGTSVMSLTPEVVDRVAAASRRAGMQKPVPVLAAGEQ